jgi:sialic acid synthase SpsE
MSLDNIIHKIQKTYIIAEIGVNHNGKLKIAMQLINTAKKNRSRCS